MHFTEKSRLPIAASLPAYKKIVFTGDILQTNVDGSPKMAMETKWLADLLRYQVSLACPAADVGMVTWGDGSSFDGARFYKLNGMVASVHNWASLEHAESITDAAAEYLAAYFRDSLVIGNTMSSFQLRVFNELGIPYVDFILHPARFLDDVFFGIRTNVADLFTVLRENAYPDEMIRLQASIHASGLRRPAPANLALGSGLFAAQHGIDKALVSGGRFFDIEDYAEPIAQFLERHRTVYVKPHPYARQTARVVAFLRALAQDSSRVRIVNDNIYSLLVNPNVSEVCGISSCAVYEAEYFGKPVTYLSDSRIELSGPSLDPWKFVAVYDAFLNPGFWAHLFGTGVECHFPPPPKTNRLRNTLHLYWGYGYLDWEVPLRTIGIYPPATPAVPAAWKSHETGLAAYESGLYSDALEHFSIALTCEETGERWNDWAAAQLRLGHKRAALDGFRMALQLDPNDSQAAANYSSASSGELAAA